MAQMTGQQGKSRISGSLLARNTLLNFIGQAIPLLVGVITIPFVIRGLGTERFGLLSLAWVVLGYLAIFDLGLGRATTKFVAEALGKDAQEEVPCLVWTAVTVQTMFGVLGGLVLAGITPLLVERVLNIPSELIREAKTTFYLLALSIPVVLISSSFRGVLEAAQRFDLVNALKIPINSLTYLLPLVGLFLGLRLPGIMALILLARVAALAAFVVMNFLTIPQLRRYAGSFSLFSRLFSFGGWVMISSIVSPILVYLDRFLIGSLLSMAALAYYSAPYEAVTRLGIIPGSLMMTLFPAFSALEGIQDRQRLGLLFARSIKYVLLVLGPVILTIGLFAKGILQLWLGGDYAIESAPVLWILASGVLFNSLAHTPFALLQGAGRPDLPAKFHLAELPIHIGIAWILISQWGIVGGAVAWTIRVTLDAFLLFGAAFKICGFSPRLFAANGTTVAALVLVVLTGIAYGLKTLAGGLPLVAQSLLIMALLILFAWLSWRNVLDHSDRRTILKLMKLGKVKSTP